MKMTQNLTINDVRNGLKHLYKKHGNTCLHIVSTIDGKPMLLTLGQNINTPNLSIKVDNSCKGLTRTALKCLHNPKHKTINTHNVTQHLNITLLDNVVCAGAIL